MSTPAPSPTPDEAPADVTQLLVAWGAGDRAAGEQLLPAVYEELHRQAARAMRREGSEHTLQATALVHEAYLRLVDQRRVEWRNRAHFFGVAAQAMRRILVDHARSHRAEKRGGDCEKLEFDEELLPSGERAVDLIALDEALLELERLDARQSQIVELRFFGGLTNEEIGEALDISPRTIKREWRLAKAWLRRQISEDNAHGGVG